MKALILCGGFAKRLGMLASDRPKALIDVGGKPVLNYIIEAVDDIDDVDEIILSTNAKFADQFEKWSKTMKTSKILRLVIEPSTAEREKLGAVAALEYAIKNLGLNDDYLLILGDNLFSFDIAEFVCFFREKKAACHIAFDIKSKEKAKLYGVLKLSENGIVTDFAEKPEFPTSTLISTGIYAFPKNSLALISEYLKTTDKKDRLGDFMAWLIKRTAVYGIPASGEWFDIGDARSLEAARKYCEKFMHSDGGRRFRTLEINERLDVLKKHSKLSEDEVRILRNGELSEDAAKYMIENVVGSIRLPVGIASDFVINGREHFIPMAIEESSVVAAASHAAKLCRSSGGFTAEADEPIMIGQIHILNATPGAEKRILQSKSLIKKKSDIGDSTIVLKGGGLKDIEVRKNGEYLTVHLLVDVRDAMGANAVNTIAERAAPLLEELSSGTVIMRIISNLAVYRKARARAIWKADELEKSFNGKFNSRDIAKNIMHAWKLAVKDPYRRATHNKGIMNGVDAVAIATGNDWRALESGAHSYSALTSEPLTRYRITKDGDIEGTIEMPVPVAVVGGATRINPVSHVCMKILGVKNSKELACVVASVGLANNFAAMRVLATEGIQKGHMKLHATNIAHMAGACGDEVGKIAKTMIREDKISLARAKELSGSK